MQVQEKQRLSTRYRPLVSHIVWPGHVVLENLIVVAVMAMWEGRLPRASPGLDAQTTLRSVMRFHGRSSTYANESKASRLNERLWISITTKPVERWFNFYYLFWNFTLYINLFRCECIYYNIYICIKIFCCKFMC